MRYSVQLFLVAIMSTFPMRLSAITAFTSPTSRMCKLLLLQHILHPFLFSSSLVHYFVWRYDICHHMNMISQPKAKLAMCLVRTACHIICIVFIFGSMQRKQKLDEQQKKANKILFALKCLLWKAMLMMSVFGVQYQYPAANINKMIR